MRLSDAERDVRMAALHGGVAAELVLALRAARMDRDLSQRGLAVLMGLSAHTVQDWEGGSDLPTIGHLFEWARLVGRRVVLVDRHGVRLKRSLKRDDGESLDQLETRRVGVILREERMRLRMTQAEVAELLGVHRVSITRWERRGPGWVALLVPWTATLGCSVHVVSTAQESAGG